MKNTFCLMSKKKKIIKKILSSLQMKHKTTGIKKVGKISKKNSCELRGHTQTYHLFNLLLIIVKDKKMTMNYVSIIFNRVQL